MNDNFDRKKKEKFDECYHINDKDACYDEEKDNEEYDDDDDE